VCVVCVCHASVGSYFCQVRGYYIAIQIDYTNGPLHQERKVKQIHLLNCYEDLHSRWGWVVNTMPQLLYLQDSPGTYCNLRKIYRVIVFESKMVRKIYESKRD